MVIGGKASAVKAAGGEKRDRAKESETVRALAVLDPPPVSTRGLIERHCTFVTHTD